MITEKEVKEAVSKVFKEMSKYSVDEVTREGMLIFLTRLSVLHWMLGEDNE